MRLQVPGGDEEQKHQCGGPGEKLDGQGCSEAWARLRLRLLEEQSAGEADSGGEKEKLQRVNHSGALGGVGEE